DGMEYSLHWYKDDAIPEFYLLNQPCGMFTSVFEPLTENPISVFPNPVSEVLEIGFQNGRITYWVYDLSGRQVLHKKEMLENKLEVGHLMLGLYFLAVENNGVFYWAKFVKN